MPKKAATTTRPVAVVGKAMTFAEVIAEARQKQEALQAEVEAMTPEQREAWDAEQQKNQAETDKLIAQLRGMGGFMSFKV